MKKPHNKRRVSAGTALMLACTVVVLAGMLFVLGALRNHSVELNGNRVLEALDLSADWLVNKDENAILQPVENAAAVATTTPGASALLTVASSGKTIATMTFGGTVAVTGTIRRSCYYSGSKKYDFDELFDLIGDAWDSDMTVVALENLVDSTQSMSSLIMPADVLTSMKRYGVDAISLGFSSCLDKGISSLQATLTAAKQAELSVIGAYAQESNSTVAARIVEINGIRIALLHYTDTLTSANQKKLTSAQTEWMVSQTSAAVEDIILAKQSGADAVIVSMNWGKSGTATVSKAQKTLAQQLADAGADVILGTGSRAVMPAVWLDRADGGKTLCCYGLGSLLNEKRTNSAIAGMLLELTFTKVDGKGTTLSTAGYRPTYIWHYEMDGVDHYRTVISNADAPEGMEDSQVKVMKKALSTTQNALGSDNPLTLLE